MHPKMSIWMLRVLSSYVYLFGDGPHSWLPVQGALLTVVSA